MRYPQKKIDFKIGECYAYDLRGKVKFDTLSATDLVPVFRDGRVTGIVAEKWICTKFRNIDQATNGVEYDHFMRLDSLGSAVFEHRIAKTASGLNLVPSYMKGKGRQFNNKEFIDKVESVDGYLFTIIDEFPVMTVGCVLKSQIRALGYPKSIRVPLALALASDASEEMLLAEQFENVADALH